MLFSVISLATPTRRKPSYSDRTHIQVTMAFRGSLPELDITRQPTE